MQSCTAGRMPHPPSKPLQTKYNSEFVGRLPVGLITETEENMFVKFAIHTFVATNFAFEELEQSVPSFLQVS